MVGPSYKKIDYEEGWALADKLKVQMVDEHYYESPEWFTHNQAFYDRSKSMVYPCKYVPAATRYTTPWRQRFTSPPSNATAMWCG